MSLKTGLRRVGKKVASAVTAVAVASTLMVAGAGTASAGPRDYLRKDSTGTCTWDPVKYWVQRCDVWSPSMGKNIKVQIQPAKRGGNAALYLLDGMRATEKASAWTVDANAPREYVNHNITLVMPVGGAGSFYSDWIGPATYQGTVNYKWETFLTKELPGYLQRQFGVSPTNNSIAGLSMGGTSAVNLAARNPNQFKQVMSWSGYLTMTLPGMQTLLRIAMLDVGNFNINSMYGTIFHPQRYQNDPFLNMGGLRGKDIYVSAASGTPGPRDLAKYNRGDLAAGTALEWFSRYTTVIWEAKARAQGLNPTVDYPAQGVHNWLQWDYQLKKTKARVLNKMNAW
ncbi:alpha/beta hydrolase [Corynebacterium sp. ZY180755]